MTTESTYARLRAANPVPFIEQTDSLDLWRRITSLAGDSRLDDAPRKPFIRRPGVVLAVAFAVAALLASTAFAISRLVGGDVVGPSVTRVEYLRAQSQLTLPPGAAWPDRNFGPDNSVTPRGAGGGTAVLVALSAWECDWVRAIRTGDVTAQRRAHAVLDALLANNILEAPAGAPEDYTPSNPPSVPYAIFAHDGGLDSIRATYAAAAAGHPRNLIQSCRQTLPDGAVGRPRAQRSDSGYRG